MNMEMDFEHGCGLDLEVTLKLDPGANIELEYGP